MKRDTKEWKMEIVRNILSSQKQECDELSNKILSNNLYLDNNIEKESKKFYKK